MHPIYHHHRFLVPEHPKTSSLTRVTKLSLCVIVLMETSRSYPAARPNLCHGRIIHEQNLIKFRSNKPPMTRVSSIPPCMPFIPTVSNSPLLSCLQLLGLPLTRRPQRSVA